MIAALLASLTIPLAPLTPFTPAPDPQPGYGSVNLLPNYTVNGDGSRMQCAPYGGQCWRDDTGLPSYES